MSENCFCARAQKMVACPCRALPFEHLDLNADVDKEEVRRYSPMGKVPALVLDSGEVLIDSAGIIDVLHEMVAPEKALIPPSGAQRFKALQLTGIGLAI